jgi:MYXO-CTERM domain-containing protein
MARSPWISAGSFVAASLVCSNLLAHVQFSYPTPRRPGSGNNDIKTGPCGCSTQACPNGDVRVPGRVTVLEPGATIMVEFTETIQHPGFYRISFDQDGQDAFEPPPLARSSIQMGTPMLPVLKDNIADTGDADYTTMITLPNVECENCTLQLIQVMTTAMTWQEDDIYYTCADIALRSGAGGSGSGGMGSGGMAAGGMNAGGMAAGGMAAGGMGNGGMGAGGMAAGMSGSVGAGGAGAGGVATTGGAGAGGSLPLGGAGMAAAATGGMAAGMPGVGGAGAVAGTTAAGGTPPATGGVGTGGTATTGGTGTVVTPEEDAGCGCRTAPRSSSLGWLALGATALVTALGRRRRRAS